MLLIHNAYVISQTICRSMEGLHLSSEEQQLVDSLRAKYSGQSRDVQSAEGSGDQDVVQSGSTGAAPQSVLAAGCCDGGGVAGVTLCPLCQGSGRVTETYHHRVLERACDHCDGAGVMMAADVQRDMGVPAIRQAGASAAATVRDIGSKAKGSMRSDAELRCDIARIDARLDGYREVRCDERRRD
jgi:DnaJ-class molecular chaperone